MPLLLSTLLLCASALTAQEFHVTKSDVFEEPEPGWNHLLQLKNGNTFLFHIADKGSIDVTVFNKNRKLNGTKNVTSKLCDVADVVKEWLYEINGEAVLFFNVRDHSQYMMVRLRFNASDGTLISEEVLAKVGLPKSNAAEIGSVDLAKDPASDYYAVVSSVRDRNFQDKIKVVHFDGEHKKINEADYKVGDPSGFRFTVYNSAMVEGNKRIYLILCGYKEKPKYDGTGRPVLIGDCEVIISRLNAGEKTFSNKTLELNVDMSEITSQMLYNRNTNKVQLRTRSLSESKKKIMSTITTRYYLSLVTYFDPETLGIEQVKPVSVQKVNEYGALHIDKDYAFQGLPSRMVLNKDNTTTILMQKTTSWMENALDGDIGISVMSDTGAELNGYAIQKSQKETKDDHNEFLSYDYISTRRGNFVLINDLASNFSKDEDDSKHKKVRSVSATNTVAYKLNAGSFEKFLFFGKPDDDSNIFSYMDGTDYCDITNTYATVIMECKGRDKVARVAWVTFD